MSEEEDSKKRAKTVQEITVELQQQRDLLEEQLEIASGLQEIAVVNKEVRKNELEIFQNLLDLSQEEINTLVRKQKMLAAQGKQLDAAEKKRLDALLEQKKELKNNLKILDEQNSAIENFEFHMGSIASRFTGVSGNARTLAGSVFKMAVSGGSFREGMKGVLANLKNTLTPANIMVSLIDKVVETTIALAIEQERVIANFNKATGAAGKFDSQIRTLERNNSVLRLSIEDAGAAYQSLFTNVADFTNMTGNQQDELAKTVAALDKLGVSAQTTSKNIDIATRALGMSRAESERLQRELFSTAQALGLPPSAIAEGFASAAPELAKHGSSMSKVFKGLAEDAKQTGLSIGDLVGMVSKFDTFEGAADAAGRLNAVLGGDLLNSMDLMMATEEERIKMLQDTITNSGKAWHEMNRFEKQAVANAAGISDMEKAGRLFNPTMAGMTEAQKKHAASMKELEALMPTVTTIMDDLRVLAARFAVSLGPVIDHIQTLISGFLEVNDAIQNKLGVGLFHLIGLAGSLLVPFILFKKLKPANDFKNIAKNVALLHESMTAVRTATQATAASTGALTAAQGIQTGAAATQGTANAAAAGSTAALGTSSVGATSGIMVLAKALTVAAPGMLAFGLAALMVGGAIYLAATGMSKFVASFKGIDPLTLLAFGASMLMMTAALAGFVAISPYAILAAVGAAVSFGLLAFAMGSVGESAKAMAEFNKTLIQLNFDPITTGYERVSELIEEIVDNVNKLSGTKGLIFTTMMVGAAAITANTKATPTANTGDMGIQRMSAAAQDNAVVKVNVVNNTAAKESQANLPQNNQVTGQVMLDGKRVGEILLNSKGPNSLTSFIDERIKMSVKEGKLA